MNIFLTKISLEMRSFFTSTSTLMTALKKIKTFFVILIFIFFVNLLYGQSRCCYLDVDAVWTKVVYRGEMMNPVPSVEYSAHGWYSSEEDCEAAKGRAYQKAGGAKGNEIYSELEISGGCSCDCDQDSSSSTSEENQEANGTSEYQQILFDDYDPNIGYVFNDETGEYEQIQLPPELVQQRKEELAAKLRAIEAAKQQEKIEQTVEFIDRATEGIGNSIDRHKERMDDLNESRRNIKDEELPIIEEDFTSSMGFDNSLEDSGSDNNGYDYDANDLSKVLNATVISADIMENEPLENFAGSAREFVDQFNIISNLNDLAQNPDDANSKMSVFEDVLDKVADYSGTTGVAYEQFAPPVNLWNETFKASFNRLDNLLDGKQTSAVEVWAPTFNYMGKVTNTGPIGDIGAAYKTEKTYSWSDLKKKYGIIQGTWRKIIFNSIDTMNQNN